MKLKRPPKRPKRRRRLRPKSQHLLKRLRLRRRRRLRPRKLRKPRQKLKPKPMEVKPNLVKQTPKTNHLSQCQMLITMLFHMCQLMEKPIMFFHQPVKSMELVKLIHMLVQDGMVLIIRKVVQGLKRRRKLRVRRKRKLRPKLRLFE